MIYFNIRECFWNAYMVLRKCWHTVGLEWHKGNWPKFLNFIKLVLNCSASTRLCKNTFVCLKCIIQYLVVYYLLCINFGMCTNREEEWEQSSGHLKSMWTRRGCLLESIEYNQPASFNPIPSSLSQYALILTTHGVHSSSTLSMPKNVAAWRAEGLRARMRIAIFKALDCLKPSARAIIWSSAWGGILSLSWERSSRFACPGARLRACSISERLTWRH